MYNEVVVFEQSQYRKEKKLASFLRGVGYGLVSLAIFLMLVQFWPIAKMEFSYQTAKNTSKSLPAAITTAKTFSEITQSQKDNEETIYPVDNNFSLVIPEVGINSKVFPDVDMAGENQFGEVLTQGVAHAYGSAFPGQGKTIYIFGHSAGDNFSVLQVNPVFYLLSKLEAGDKIEVYYNTKKFVYFVTEKKIVSPTETSFLKDIGSERLILQTCWPPGTRWQRLIVVAESVPGPTSEI